MNQSSPALTPPVRHRLDQQIAESLTLAIVRGEHPVGTTLPPERELAAHLGVNRTSLRQAIARLEQAGLVEARQGHGTVVLDPTVLTDPLVVRARAVVEGPTFLAELLELRDALGAFLGRLAAERAEPGDLGALAADLAALDAAADAAQCQRAELALFATLVAASHNRALALLFRWADATYGDRPEAFLAAFEDRRAVREGLGVVVRAVSEHRAGDAADALERYCRDSALRMLAAVGVDPLTAPPTPDHHRR